MESLVSISAQGNLVFQTIILVVIFASLLLKNRRKFFLHGSTMMIAVILNALSLIMVMGPSLLDLRQSVINRPISTISLATLTHVSLGTLAEILGVWVILSWRLRSSIQHCVRKKKMMQVTFALWLIAMFSGILLYVSLYII